MKKPWQIIFTQSLIRHCSLSGSHHVVTLGERKPHSLLDTNTVALRPQRREAPGGATLWDYTCPGLALFAMSLVGSFFCTEHDSSSEHSAMPSSHLFSPGDSTSERLYT